MKKIAIIGTVGVPAKYGGYETLVENLLDYKQSDEISYQIYCSSKSYSQKQKYYKDARLVYIPLKANGMQSVFYDSLSLIHAVFTCDLILSLGTVSSFIMPIVRLFSKKRIIVNLDGLDNQREKFNSFSQRMIGKARRLAAKYADVCISDNQGIKDYALQVYHRESELIEYGGDNAGIVRNDRKLLEKYGLSRGTYCFKVARIEPENNIELILRAFSKMRNEKLVIVGNFSHSEFSRRMKEEYSVYENILMLNPIYEKEEINLLRSNCRVYIHGHSAGGTNPSLVEAMYLQLPIIAYGVVYNRETTENKAFYFNDEETLIQVLSSVTSEQLSAVSHEMYDIACRRYLWKIICSKYENLF